MVSALLLACVVHAPLADAAKKKSARGTPRRGGAACSDMHTAQEAIAAAERFEKARQREPERDCWQRAAELDDEDPAPLVRLGNIAHVDGKLEAARALLEQARTLAPASSHVHSSVASVEYSLGGPHFSLAVAHYQLAISLPGGLTVHNLNNLGISLAAVKEWRAADRTYRLALRLWCDEAQRSPGSTSLRPSASSAAASTKELVPPHNQQQQQQVHTHGVSVMLNMGNALVETRRYDDAIQIYKRLLRVSPSYAIGHYSLGRAYDRARHITLAAAAYHRALHFDAHLVNAYSNLGVAMLNQNRPADAVSALQVAVRLQPSANDLNNLGDALGDSGRYTDAIGAYDRALDVAQVCVC